MLRASLAAAIAIATLMVRSLAIPGQEAKHGLKHMERVTTKPAYDPRGDN